MTAELRRWVFLLVRRWPVLVALAALAAAGGYGATLGQPPRYRAAAQLSVTPSVIDFFVGEAVNRLLANYALQLGTRSFAEVVAGDLPDLRPDDIAGRVRAVAIPAEFRIAVEIEDSDPQRAARIANAVATRFALKVQAEAAGHERRNVQVEVMERAQPPDQPFAPRPRLSALTGAVLGAVFGALLVVVLELVEDRVRSVEEAGYLLGWPVLAAVPAPGPAGLTGRLRPVGVALVMAGALAVAVRILLGRPG